MKSFENLQDLIACYKRDEADMKAFGSKNCDAIAEEVFSNPVPVISEQRELTYTSPISGIDYTYTYFIEKNPTYGVSIAYYSRALVRCKNLKSIDI